MFLYLKAGDNNYTAGIRAQNSTGDENWKLQGNNSGTTELNVTTGNLELSTTADKQITFKTLNTERLRITGAGNVGIGTTTPSYKLDIETSGSSNALRLANTDGTNNPNLTITADSSGIIYNNQWAANAISHIFKTYGTERLRINAFGVGIGLTGNATAKLHIKGTGTTSATTALLVENANASASLAVLDNGRVGIGTTNPGRTLHVLVADNDEVARFTSTQGNDAYIQFQSNTSVTLPRFGIVNNDFIFIPSGSETIRFAHNGNVGINTSTPLSRLHVNGDIRTDEDIVFTGTGFIRNNATNIQVETVGTKDILLSSTRNVGIKTSSPSYTLDVSGSGNFTDGLTVTGSLTTSTFTASSAVINGDVTIYGTASVDVLITNYESSSIIYSSGSTKFGDTLDDTHQFTGSMYVTGSTATFTGNVGVGTTSPSTKLHVAGDARITGNRLDLNSNTRITGQYYVNSSYEYTYITMYNGGNASINIGTRHPLSYISFESGNGAYTERMRITNTGNVGIGTTAPSAKLQVQGSGTTSATTALRVENANASASLVVTDASLVQIANPSYTTSTAANFEGILLSNTAEIRSNSNDLSRVANFRLYSPNTGTGAFELYRTGVITTQLTAGANTSNDYSFVTYGNFGLGTTTPSQGKLVISSDTIRPGSTSLLYVTGSTSETYDLARFVSDNTARVVISNSGSIGIGTTTPVSELQVVGTITTTALVETSARRYKEDIKPLEPQLEKVNRLNPVNFTWKENKKEDVGFIAEEMQEIFPELVSESADGQVEGIQYSKLTAVLVKALQEQQKQINDLKEEIFILKNK